MIIRIDDHDPQVQFTPKEAWRSGGVASEYKETTRGTTKAGALMTLNFTGTGVEVYGSASIRPAGLPLAVLNHFTVDDGTPVQWSQDPKNWTGSPFNVKMFSELDLEDGAHMLVMQVGVQGSTTWIDYLEVTSNKSSEITTSSAELTSSPPPSDKPSSSTSEVLLPGTAAVWGLRRRWRRSKRSGEAEAEDYKVSQALNESTFDPAIIQIFDSVTLPSLKKLSVGFHNPGEDEDSDRKRYATQLPFEGLLQRSQCPLTHLEMFRPRIVTAEAVIRVLQQLKTLVSLNLGHGCLTREKRQQSFTRVYSSPQVPSWINQNVAQTWRRDWLDRILREFLAGPDEDIESRADAFTVLPLCSRLEELNIGECAIDDRDTLLNFATRIRRADLGTFRVDFGRPLRDDVWKIFESLQMQRQDSEVMRVTRDVGGVMLDWRWEETSEDPMSEFDTATTDPEEESWWNVESLGQ
ncbi:hypothetical protein PQX77_022366 [Marasmius sp. AFHP31]|nr:hypothetical protein PQX77_022366 [Marasmius sp. AFHP31]